MAGNGNTKGNAILNQAEKVSDSYTNGDKIFNEKNLQNTQKLTDQENKAIEAQRIKDYLATADNIIKQQETSKLIDDGYFNNLPKSILRMYKDGDFGDTSTKEGKKRAKNTMGLAIVGTLADALGNIGNSVSAVGGIAGTYQGGNNFVDKIRKTNLEEGLRNKWEKQKQTTQRAIDLVKKRSMDEEEAQSSVQRLTSNARMQSQFNRMTQDEKAYAIEVARMAGEQIGTLSNPEVLQLMQGMLATGASAKETALILGMRYAPEVAGTLYKNLTGEEMPSDLSEVIETLGATVKTGIPDKETNNGHKIKLSDDSEYDVGITANKKDFDVLNKEATNLEQQWLDGQIDDETYLEKYGAIYNEWGKHKLANINYKFAEPTAYLEKMKQNKATYIKALETRTAGKQELKDAQKELEQANIAYENAKGKEKNSAKANVNNAKTKVKQAELKIKTAQADIDRLSGVK